MGNWRLARRIGDRTRLRRLGALSLLAAAPVLLTSCGSDDGGAPTASASEKAGDVEILNGAIGREMALVTAYSQGLPLTPQFKPAAEQLRAQAQEHIDGLTKSIRGLGGRVEAEEEEEVDLSEVKSEADFLTYAYGMEGGALAAYLDAAAHLESSAPRRLAAALAASEGQHLAVLRQGLGAGLTESFPTGFDTGSVPPPEPANSSSTQERG